MLLGVNIDHIAVLREARQINDPDPLDALGVLKISGANQVTIHLREDRRHIHDDDVRAILSHSHLPVNLECSIDANIIKLALKLKPHRITLVPEKRQEVTTEGGLDIGKNYNIIEKIIEKAHKIGIEVSLFIDPNEEFVKLSKKLKADWIELHTGHFSNIYAMLFSNLSRTKFCIKEFNLPKKKLENMFRKSILDLKSSAKLANNLGLKVAAGHGLNYQNVSHITKIAHVKELNIGQSIVARSVFVGLEKAIKQMRKSF
ncbi:MAG: pyridoxine 5'-phosphate synthase [Proteobacteria bacterium]|nr:MAG: pyridoxine 5'-phosphate synthase [Pseudomonadota bacterium]